MKVSRVLQDLHDLLAVSAMELTVLYSLVASPPIRFSICRN
jgi:hypothetical protein